MKDLGKGLAIFGSGLGSASAMLGICTVGDRLAVLCVHHCIFGLTLLASGLAILSVSSAPN